MTLTEKLLTLELIEKFQRCIEIEILYCPENNFYVSMINSGNTAISFKNYNTRPTLTGVWADFIHSLSIVP